MNATIQRSPLPQLIYNRETKQWVAATPKKKLPPNKRRTKRHYAAKA